MQDINRRTLLVGIVAASGALAPAMAQQSAEPAKPAPSFGYDDVVKRARDLAGAPFDAQIPALPDSLARLDFDAWRDIRFKSDKLLLEAGGPFRLELFHLGHLYKRPVTVNILRDGLTLPVPYAANLFDYGRNKIDGALPINLGFAGFRLHYPLNAPHVMDEVIAFLGASYFRFLGRGQRYGLSARGLSIGAGGQEEFPFFREFWIESPAPGAERVIVYGLLDGESATGAFHFEIYPGMDTSVEVTATLFARKAIPALGMAALSSMFLAGKNDHRFDDDFRTELHDSDGLLIHAGSGEWIWRPLSNPVTPALSTFLDKDVRGFGLLQRDRSFEHYQDLDLAYELRPSYWIEPREGWGEGQIGLVELPTSDETNDNRDIGGRPLDNLWLSDHRADERRAPDARRPRDQHLSHAATRAWLGRSHGPRRDTFPDRFLGRRPVLFPQRPLAGRSRADHFGRENHAFVSRAEFARARLSRRHRHPDRSRPVLRSARLPQRRQSRADRDLDLSLAGVTRTISSKSAPRARSLIF
jgi:glucans biosynthesis protein